MSEKIPNIKLADGTEMPYIEYQFVGAQRLGVLGIDSNRFALGGKLELPLDKWKVEPVGYLSDIKKDLAEMVEVSLKEDGWNFLRYGNPFVLLLTPIGNPVKLIVS